MFLNIYTFTHIKQEFIKKKVIWKDKASACNTTGHNTTKRQINATKGIITCIISHSNDRGGGHTGGIVGANRRHNTRINATTTHTASMQCWITIAMLVNLVLYCTRLNARTSNNCFLIVEWTFVAADQAQFKRNNGIQ